MKTRQIPIAYRHMYPERDIFQPIKARFEKFGFNVVEEVGIPYFIYLEVPENVRCTTHYIDFDRRTFSIYDENDMPLITINQKISPYNQAHGSSAYVNHYVNDDANQDEFTLISDDPFQKKVEKSLLKLYNFLNNVTQNAADSDYNKNLLFKYYIENPYACLEVINRDQKLLMVTSILEAARIPMPSLTSTPAPQENEDPALLRLKDLCYDYATELYKHNNYDTNRLTRVTEEKIEALKELRKAIDDTTSSLSEPNANQKINEALKKVAPILKQDQDYKAIRFLKQFARIIKAALTRSYSTKKAESLAETGSHKFWKSEQELQGKKFIRELKKAAGIKKPKA